MSVQPYAHPQLVCAITLYICMIWIWDAVCKILQPESLRSGMDSTLESPRTSANCPLSGETSVVVMLCVCSHCSSPELLKVLRPL